MRVPWSEDALLSLEDIADRAPRAAHHVYDSVRWLAVQQFARLFRPVIGRPGEHVMSVPPYVVVYGVDGDAITVLTIKDGRQVQDPWEHAPTGWTLCPCSEFGIDRAGERSPASASAGVWQWTGVRYQWQESGRLAPSHHCVGRMPHRPPRLERQTGDETARSTRC